MNPQKTKLSIPLILLIGAIAAQTIISCSSADIPDLPPPDGISDLKGDCIRKELAISANTLNDIIDACDGVKKSEILSMLEGDNVGTCDKNDLPFDEPLSSIKKECGVSEIAIVAPSSASASGKSSSSSPWSITTDGLDGNVMVGYEGNSTVGNAQNQDGSYVVLVKDGGETVPKVQDYVLGSNLRTGDGYSYAPHVELILKTANSEYEGLSGCASGFKYEYKGSAHKFMAVMDAEVVDQNIHYKIVTPASTTWTQAEVSPASLTQESGWGKMVTLDISKITEFRWEIRGETGISSSTGSLAIKNLNCIGSTSTNQYCYWNPGACYIIKSADELYDCMSMGTLLSQCPQ